MQSQYRQSELLAIDSIAQASTRAANALLTIANFDEAVNTALQIIGEALDTDRVVLIENFDSPSNSTFPSWRALGYEWNSPGTVPQYLDPNAAQGSYEEIPDIFEPLHQGQPFSFLIEEMSELFRSAQMAIGVKATHAIPILVEGQWWGLLGLDDCREAKRRNAVELSVLKIAADCIGSAIQRQRTQQALLDAEQAKVAELAQANAELIDANERIREYERQKSTLLSITADIAAASDAVELMSVIREKAQQLIPFYDTGILIVEPDGHYHYDLAVNLSGWDTSESNQALQQAELFRITHPGSYVAAVMGRIEAANAPVIEDYEVAFNQFDYPFFPLIQQIGMKEGIVTTLKSGGRTLGTLWLNSLKKGHFQPQQFEIFQALADQVAVAVANILANQEVLKRDRQLHKNNRLLEATTAATNALLTTANFDNAVNAALQIIGEALDTDRVVLIETFYPTPDSPLPWWRALGYEWTSSGTVPQYRDQNAAQGSYEDIPEIYEPLHQGLTFSFSIEDISEPFRSAQTAIGVQATHAVPIFIEGQWWGLFGIDDCREAKRRSAAELSLLKIAADCIGSAIQRQRSQQEMLEAGQTRVAELAEANERLQQRKREVQRSYRLLSTVAQVTKNLLENSHVEEAIAHALQNIGEAAGISRMLLMQETREVNSRRLQHQVIQEWSDPNIPRQMDDPVTSTIYNDEYDSLVIDLYAGHSIWRILDDLPEPARTQQARIAVKSTGAVPIFIEGNYFGCVGFDDCVDYRQWTAHDIDVLTSAAGAIGAALYRQQLGDRLIAAVLEERSRFARDIHDTLAQAFTGVLMQLEATKRKITTSQLDTAQDHLVRARNLALEGLSEARRSVRALRPEVLESLDLPNALRRMAEQATADTNLAVSVRIEGVPRALPSDLETNLLRIAQEALTNVLRHAHAQTICLTLLFELGTVHLYVRDDGQGFDPESQLLNGGFGLIGMQERSQRLGGQLTLKSSPGQGTTITVSLPITA